uniref:Chemosensory protein CSP19 n=1 Tax=Lobesia botrana TaxID=209534 RepID=A0A345BEP1_9NEOP|nr:chemosensory protein CSP19 [Lobesia botrana]
MKVIVFACLLAVVVSARPGDKYTDRYDNVDLNEILNNRRLLVPYVKCLLGQGKCTPDGKELKSHIKEALENGCAKCTESQRVATRQVIGHLINKESAYWNQLVTKYDSQRKYVAKYESELRAVRA